ncbi:SMP-30/gluconolactonase/LRE family protein [Enterovirga rhinocerotis]|uniref:Sugar lactone lactonase YvrE n=1 Tax=Enterovirga rhinocerotis TaxID=1339210 RepID=A0A4R7BY53_9HYPH|nr:SMP-30/gluconolactonase/LRE family protein [Enterovirga rhinocerotis]TDR89137.1 sugar lactone lactonase YvrE [Enterovirga rhinocerotis]
MSVEVFPLRAEVAVPCGCVLGEGAIWDQRTGTLFWVDINEGALWSWRPQGGEEAVSRPLGERVGFVLLTPDPDVVMLGLKSGLARFDLSSGTRTALLSPESDLPGNRLNDGTAAPDGSIYFGSLNESDRQPSGHFYHWTGERLSRFGESTVTTNGPAVDPARGRLYATDTSRRRVCHYPIGQGGSLGERRDYVTFGPEDGHPDGMAVDAEGHVWICHFGGGRITRFDPDGEPVLVVPMPTPQVTKLAFGGPDLDTIYVTTAARDLDREIDPMAGHVFKVAAGIRGLPAQFCRVGLG